MPRILLFAPCQKAILDRADNSLSIIGVMQGLIFPMSGLKEKPIPENAAVSLSWGAACVWMRTPGDDGKEFEQLLEIVDPNGRKHTGKTVTKFKMPERLHHIAVSGSGFPLGVPGEWRIVLSMRESGKQEEWKMVADYPVEITHLSKEEEQAANAPTE